VHANFVLQILAMVGVMAILVCIHIVCDRHDQYRELRKFRNGDSWARFERGEDE
jgi:hypothetical protein